MGRGIAALRKPVCQLLLVPHWTPADGHLAGSDAERADALLGMLKREDVDGVICRKGGWARFAQPWPWIRVGWRS